MQVELSRKVSKQIQKLGLAKQFEKQKALFLTNPFHPSLDFKPLKGQNKGFYAFRINDQYRARLLKLGFQALAPEKVRLADNDGLMPRDESEGVFPEKVPFREIFLWYSTYFQLFENV